MFPFLIGKVLTVDGSLDKIDRIRDKFPFLIGKVLTKQCTFYDIGYKIMFPFLIGKVLTTAFKPL